MPIGDCSTFLERFPTWNTTTKASITAYQNKGSTTQADNTAIILLEKDILDASLCVGNAIKDLSSSSGDVASIHEQIGKLTADLEEAEKDVRVAKNRVAYIRHPEQQTSNYESWFPIDRPIHVVSLIVLMSLCIFMGIFFLLILMAAMGMNIMLYIPPQLRNTSPFLIWLSMQMTWSFGIMLVILISVVIYFVNRK
jgi:hypothetical protein